MSLPRFDIRLMRAAVAVRDAGSVTAAARILGMGQPALSRLIAGLEAELGFRLFTRQGRRIQPLPAATDFLDHAAALQASAHRLGLLALDIRAGRRATIRIASLQNLALGPLQDALARFAERFENVEVQVQLRSREEIRRLLIRGECDFATVPLPMDVQGLRVRPFAEAEAVCLLRADHSLAEADWITPEMLDGADMIVLPDQSMLRPRIDAAFAASASSYRRRFTVDTNLMAARLVAAGLGVAIMQPLDRRLVPSKVVVRRFRPVIGFTYALVERLDGGFSVFGDALTEALRQEAASGQTA